MAITEADPDDNDGTMLALENSPRGELRASTDSALAERPGEKTTINYRSQVVKRSIEGEAEGSRPVRQRLAAITVIDGQENHVSSFLILFLLLLFLSHFLRPFVFEASASGGCRLLPEPQRPPTPLA